MWQKCPICDGVGIKSVEDPDKKENKVLCPVCKGGLIIDENGNPPKEGTWAAAEKRIAENIIEIFKILNK